MWVDVGGREDEQRKGGVGSESNQKGRLDTSEDN